MPTDVFGFVFKHTDTCPGCSFGEFCEEGRRLMRLASEICRVLVTPFPPVPRSPIKA